MIPKKIIVTWACILLGVKTFSQEVTPSLSHLKKHPFTTLLSHSSSPILHDFIYVTVDHPDITLEQWHCDSQPTSFFNTHTEETIMVHAQPVTISGFFSYISTHHDIDAHLYIHYMTNDYKTHMKQIALKIPPEKSNAPEILSPPCSDTHQIIPNKELQLLPKITQLHTIQDTIHAVSSYAQEQVAIFIHLHENRVLLAYLLFLSIVLIQFYLSVPIAITLNSSLAIIVFFILGLVGIMIEWYQTEQIAVTLCIIPLITGVILLISSRHYYLGKYLAWIAIYIGTWHMKLVTSPGIFSYLISAMFMLCGIYWAYQSTYDERYKKIITAVAMLCIALSVIIFVITLQNFLLNT